MTAPQLYAHLKNMLRQNGIESPEFEAMCILEHISGKKLSRLLLERPEMPQETETKANNIIYRRISGYPLQYILGEWEFYGLPFYVGEGVLIPRQDTETLAETALDFAKRTDKPKVLDLCSGSGCLAVTIAKNIPSADVTAVEISETAIGYIRKNAELNNVRVSIVSGDVLRKETAEKFSDADIIVCNPPYLTAEDMTVLQKEVSFEPQTALFGGEDGLDFYRKITVLWKDTLKKGGVLAYEIGMEQEKDVRKILEENQFENIEEIKDLSGIIRVVRGEKI